MSTIVRDGDVRSGDARIEGTRITVLDVKRRVIDLGEDPHVVAGEYEVPMADLFRALTYYYDNRDELEAREREATFARKDGEQATRELLEERNEEVDPGERAD